MEISTSENLKLNNIISKVIKDSKLELEVRLGGKHLSLFDQIDRNLFDKILKKLTFNRENGGYQLNYTVSNSLDIIESSDNKSDNIRITLPTLDGVKRYIYSNVIDNSINISKTRIDMLDINNYNLRISLSSEIKTTNKKTENILSNNKIKKYRYKKRYSVITEDNLFRYDLTVIKSYSGTTLNINELSKALSEYEVEMEYIGSIKDKNAILQSLILNTGVLLQVYYNSNILSSNQEQQLVTNEYKKMLKQSKPVFIASNPVTLHRQHIDTGNIINITQDYAVSYKADGERHFLYIIKSSNTSVNGNIYMIDKNFNIKKTGWKLPSWGGTLIEGEYIDTLNIFLGYDILYAKNNDIRQRAYSDTRKQDDEKEYMRSMYLSYFMNNFTKDVKVIYNELDTNNLIRIQKKEVLMSMGTQIFSNVQKLISGKNNLEYETDGFIFTPIKDNYPSTLGSWNKLLKWKPPELNSIDFLIVIKQDNKVDKIDTITLNNKLLFYKTIYLQVGKNVGKNYIAANFQPQHPKNENAYIAKILLDDNERMMTEDLTNELTNDIVVEFVYRKNEVDFKWIPIRIRYDKTDGYKRSKINNKVPQITANNINTANDIWTNIHYPVDEHMLTSGEIDGNIPNISKIKNVMQNAIETHDNKNNGDDNDDDDNDDDDNNKNNGDGVSESKGENVADEEVSYYTKTDIKKRMPYQKFNNFIKEQLIRDTVFLHKGGDSGVKLLDIASGKGGDLQKWFRSEVDFVIGIDISKGDVEEGIRRYNSFKNSNDYKRASVKTDVHLVWGDSSKLVFPDYNIAKNDQSKSVLEQYIPDKNMFDIVSCQFAFHYFFANQESLLNAIRNVSENLKIGGHFIGTTFDGDRIMKLLKNKTEYESYINNQFLWKIEKKYTVNKFPGPLSQDNLGLNIDVHIDSIGNVHTEPLVNFKYFERTMKQNGFVKVNVDKFDKYFKNSKLQLDNKEKELSFLYNTFTFKKIAEFGEHKIKVKKNVNK
jgi:SAM-dependent methyltransferase